MLQNVKVCPKVPTFSNKWSDNGTKESPLHGARGLLRVDELAGRLLTVHSSLLKGERILNGWSWFESCFNQLLLFLDSVYSGAGFYGYECAIFSCVLNYNFFFHLSPLIIFCILVSPQNVSYYYTYS